MRMLALLLMSILLLGILLPTHLASGRHNEEKQMKQELIPDRYIVVLKDKVNKDSFAKAHGLSKIKEYKHALNGMTVTGPLSHIKGLKYDERVLFVQQDQIFRVASQTLPTGINRIDAELNPIARIDGTEQSVDTDIAILDTGVSSHEDLYLYRACNFLGSANCSGLWGDTNGHGTHVAGIAAAIDNDKGVVGVAPGARIWVGTVLNSLGSGSLSDIIEGIDWVTANSSAVDVVNMSLGGSGSDDGNCGMTNGDALHLAICNSVAKGIVYVVAAGNSATDASTQIPAAYDEVITVSAIADFDGQPGRLAQPTCRYDEDDTFANFSNYGADVDIAAPGVCILSTWPWQQYKTISGTSMAAPHVAGAAALYIAANGKPQDAAGAALVKQGLINLATPQSSSNGFTGDKDLFPEPLLNAKDSISSLPTSPEPSPSPSPSPSPTPDTSPPQVTILSPKNGQQVSNHVLISVTASDDSGIGRVDIYIGGKLKTTLYSVPYEYKWQSNSVKNGSVTIAAYAYDMYGNKASASISVTVYNESKTK